ncbi:MAG: FAD:protein FMN transferase [Dehalococcoidia bacterium]
MNFEDHFRAMGTDVDVVVAGDAPPLAAFISLHLLFEREEQRFSRFRPDSLLSRLNAGDAVDDETFASVCRLSLEAFEATGGLFNPMILPSLTSAGYDRTFDRVGGGRLRPEPAPALPEALQIRGDTVQLAQGALDLGGIVKGWTVDRAVETFRDECPDLLVNAGGDLRAEGSEDGTGEGGWELSIADHRTAGAEAWAGRWTGALATSTTLKRRWRLDDGAPAHHLIDPRTGLPAGSSLVQVSVWAEQAWWAEIWAKAVLIGGLKTVAGAERAGCRVLPLEG